MLFINIFFDVVVFGILIPTLFVFLSINLDKNLFMLKMNSLFLRALGFSLIFVGFLLIAWAYYLIVKVGRGYTLEFFGKNLLTATKKLVTLGPYSKIRHPIALGYLVMILGIAFITNSFSGLFILFPLMVITTCFYLIFFEERALSKRFKEEFKEYKENTNFLIPFPKKLIRGKVTDLTVGKKR